MKKKIQKYIIYIYIYINTYFIYPQNLKLKMFFVKDIKVNLNLSFRISYCAVLFSISQPTVRRNVERLRIIKQISFWIIFLYFLYSLIAAIFYSFCQLVVETYCARQNWEWDRGQKGVNDDHHCGHHHHGNSQKEKRTSISWMSAAHWCS